MGIKPFDSTNIKIISAKRTTLNNSIANVPQISPKLSTKTRLKQNYVIYSLGQTRLPRYEPREVAFRSVIVGWGSQTKQKPILASKDFCATKPANVQAQAGFITQKPPIFRLKAFALFCRGD